MSTGFKAGAPPGSPPTARVLESGEGNRCAFGHEAGGAVVAEKLVESGSPEADIFAAFAKGRLRLPEGEALRKRGFLPIGLPSPGMI